MFGIAKSLHLFGIMNVICYCIMASLAADCNTPGWFGERCQYKCHCDPANSCGKDGSCSKCEKWWFGPACQYADLMKHGHISTASIEAGDGICESYKHWIHFKWDKPIYLTWLRIKYREDIQDMNGIKVKESEELNIKYNNGRGSMYFVNHESVLIDNKTMDIYCDLNRAVTQVNISGSQLTSLCTVHISGGRNVALKQETHQTSSHHGADSQRAVDGNVNSDFNGGSCTHTSVSDDRAKWDLTFPNTYSIYQYVIYNTNNYMYRLSGFKLFALDSNKRIVFQHTDSEKSPQLIYTIKSDSMNSKIKKVAIYPRWITDIGEYLRLCEVEIYGDLQCPAGHYGRDCENKCKCAVKDEKCYFTTGICPSGCALGYHQDGCQKACDHDKWGLNCLKTCDYRCLGDECDKSDGRCINGCKAGYIGDRCKRACKAGTHGINCTQVCPLNCNDKPCDIVNGHCYGCKNGYTGNKCDQECEPGKFGKDCVHICSNQCLNTLCNHRDGTCINCPLGKMGDQCERG